MGAAWGAARPTRARATRGAAHRGGAWRLRGDGMALSGAAMWAGRRAGPCGLLLVLAAAAQLAMVSGVCARAHGLLLPAVCMLLRGMALPGAAAPAAQAAMAPAAGLAPAAAARPARISRPAAGERAGADDRPCGLCTMALRGARLCAGAAAPGLPRCAARPGRRRPLRRAGANE